MKILLITTSYPTPVRPNQSAFNATLCSAWKRDHEVRVIAPVPWPQAFAASGNPPPSAREPDTLHPLYFYPPKIARRHYAHFYWHSIRRTVIQLGTTFKPDLVIGYWLHPDAAAANRAASYFDVPSLAISGGSDLQILTENPERRREVVSVIEKVDRLVVVCRELANRARELGIPSDKLHVIDRGIDKGCFFSMDKRAARRACGIAEDAIVLLWAGRLEPVKNPHLLLQAALRWRQRWGKRLCLLMAGDGSLRREVRRECDRFALQEHVRLEGNLDQRALAVRFNAADVTVLTSRSEGKPNVLLESIACGVPFVATAVGGVPEIAEAGIDRLVANEDLDALVDAVIWRVESQDIPPRHHHPPGLSEMAAQFNEVFASVPRRTSFSNCDAPWKPHDESAISWPQTRGRTA